MSVAFKKEAFEKFLTSCTPVVLSYNEMQLEKYCLGNTRD